MLPSPVSETLQKLATGGSLGLGGGHCFPIGRAVCILEHVCPRYSGTYCLLCEGFPSRPAGRPGGIMSALFHQLAFGNARFR